MSRELPILFSSPMVRAILDGRKSVTRRVIKPQPVLDNDGMWHWKDCQWMDGGLGFPASGIADHARYQPGDILWVRETWCKLWELDIRGQITEGTEAFYYAADGYNPTPFNTFPDEDGFAGGRDCPRWSPSIHMPREAARLFLRVTDVRAERVQDVSVQDAKDEGIRVWASGCIDGMHYGCYNGDKCVNNVCTRPIDYFRELWDSINAKRGFGWDTNPWSWVYEFERLEAKNG